MTKKEVRDILAWFRSNVGLSGWTIDVQETASVERDDLGAQSTDLTTRTAKIWLVPDRHLGETGEMADVQHTLFHELIHCFLDDCAIEGEGDRVEFCINTFARLLLKQYRDDCK